MFSPGQGAVLSGLFILSLYKGWLPFAYKADIILKGLIVVIPLIIFFYTLSESSLSLFHRVTGMRSSFMPVRVSRLGFGDTLVIIFLILLKYPFKALSLVPSYQTAPDGKHILLPELRLDSSLALDESDYARYDAATKTQSVPAKSTDPVKSGTQGRSMLLPAVTTPMMLVLMANRYLPVLPFGAVNTANRFEFVDPDACRDPVGNLDLGTNAVVNARVGGDKLLGRRVKRGVEFDVLVEVKAPRKGEKQAKVVFRQYITVLAALSKSAKPVFDATAVVADDGLSVSWAKQPNSAVSLNSSSPGKWAAVCRDYNPIHMSSVMAKLFGFTGKIAHGNQVVACAVEELQSGKEPGVAERGLKSLLASKQSSYLEAQFKRPMILPTDLAVRYGSSKDLTTFAISAEKGEKEYVSVRAGQLHE